MLVCYLPLVLVSCDRTQSQQPTVSPAPSEQSRTKVLRAADAVGYDGTKLQKQVDDVLARKQTREKESEKQLRDADPN